MGIYRMQDLMKATGLTRRIIRFYVQKGLLPPAEGRGTGTNYREEHLVRLRAVRRLFAEYRSIAAIHAQLRKMSPDQIAKLGAAPLLHEEARVAPAAAGTGAPALAEVSGPKATAHLPGAERWDRIVLLPGLELHVRAGAGPLVQRTAEEIRSRYSIAPTSESPGG